LGTNFLSLERLRLPLCLCVVHALFRGPREVTRARKRGTPLQMVKTCNITLQQLFVLINLKNKHE